jgi:hypothetical protein
LSVDDLRTWKAVIILLFLAFTTVYSASVKAADKCQTDGCTISDNCQCSSDANPLAVEDSPQLISLTFDEAVVIDIFEDLWTPLLFDRKNPDGGNIGATFFVPHEYTDYQRVQNLYLRGFEIGVNSITKNSLAEYWSSASEETLNEEFGGQRTIISTFANIPAEDIIGARTPQLQLEGDVSINAYVAAGLQYDSSWTSRSNRVLFPYTLDYLSTQECRTGTTCPSESHPGFWIAPINNLQGNNSIECNSFTTCFIAGSADDISTWLLQQVDRNGTNKAPLTLMVPSSWFRFVSNSFEGFEKFLDELGGRSDVFLVSQQQVIEWMKNPVPVDQFKTDVYDRTADCNAINCPLINANNEIRYMKSCVNCPEVYPWLGNPTGQENPTEPPDTTTTTAPTEIS